MITIIIITISPSNSVLLGDPVSRRVSTRRSAVCVFVQLFLVAGHMFQETLPHKKKKQSKQPFATLVFLHVTELNATDIM